MSWIYQQSNGILRDRCGLLVGVGYSGSGPFRNLPSAQTLIDRGPIPRGFWDILGPPEDMPDYGPYVLRLQPHVDTKTFSREDFVIHGDCVYVPKMVSRGSIVLPCVVRRDIWESGDYILQVIA